MRQFGWRVLTHRLTALTRGPAILYPLEPKDQAAMQGIRQKLNDQAQEFFEAKSDALGFTAFFWIERADGSEVEELKKTEGVADVYHYEEYYKKGEAPPAVDPDDPADDPPNDPTDDPPVGKRDLQITNFWELSQVSTPPGVKWKKNPGNNFYYHKSSGAGQFVYLVDDGIWDDHLEFQNALVVHRPGADYADKDGDYVSDPKHGSGTTSKVLGQYLGITKDATAVILDKKYRENAFIATVNKQTTVVREKYLESLLNAADDIATKKRSSKSVVNMSFGLDSSYAPPQYFIIMRAILQELDKLDTVLVCSSGNDGEKRDGIHKYPSKFLQEGHLPNLIVVGSTDVNCKRASRSSHADWMTTYAPGSNVHVPGAPPAGYRVRSGTSYAAPLVAGLAAYYRGLPLPEPWKSQLQKPRNVKALVRHFHRHLSIPDPGYPEDQGRVLQDTKPIIWNAQVLDKSCLLDRPFAGDEACGPPLPADLNTLPLDGGESVQGNGDGLAGSTITYQSGPPSPTFTTNCGTLCTGYYCRPNPTGKPPDFADPVNTGNCAFKTTTTQCNGSGSHTVCVPVEVCTTPTDLPTLTGKPTATHTGSCLASGAVSTCAMGPGGQSACITSTTCTSWASASSAATSTQTSSTSLPTPTNFLVIALEETLMYSDTGGDWSREWRVFSSPVNRVVDMCHDHPIFTQSTTSASGLSPGFPPSLGPFKAQGFDCTYRGTEDKEGVLVCDGVLNMACERVRGDFAEGCTVFNNPVLIGVMVCRW